MHPPPLILFLRGKRLLLVYNYNTLNTHHVNSGLESWGLRDLHVHVHVHVQAESQRIQGTLHACSGIKDAMPRQTEECVS